MAQKYFLLLTALFLSVLFFVPSSVKAAGSCFCLSKDEGTASCQAADNIEQCASFGENSAIYSSCNQLASDTDLTCQARADRYNTNKDEQLRSCQCVSNGQPVASCERPSDFNNATQCSNLDGIFLSCTQGVDKTSCLRWATDYNDAHKVQTPPPATTQGTTDSAGQTVEPASGQFLSGFDCINARTWAEYKDVRNGDCASITVFFSLMFKIIRYLFSIVGGAALLYFIYGGFILILSQGNGEKVEQGKAVIMAAVLGIIIAFSGYALIVFVGNVAGITQEYQLNPVGQTTAK